MFIPLKGEEGARAEPPLSHIVPADAKLYLAQETCGMNVNTPAQPFSGTMDVDEFMAFLETRPKGEHWDLIEGVAVMMAPPTVVHQRIAHNLCNLLHAAFSARRLNLFAYTGLGVRTPGVHNFQPQPDVIVLPGAARYELYSEHFQLAVEVLSPSNTRTEIDLKLRRYREAPDSLYVVVIDSREFLVEVYSKSREWQPLSLKEADDQIDMPEFGLHCRLIDLYRGTPLDPEFSAS
jgi:Uma2 family endonuclease